MEEPVKALAETAIEGAQAVVKKCQNYLKEYIADKGDISRIDGSFPVYSGLTGRKVETVSDLRAVFEHADELLPKTEAHDSLWLPYLGDALNAGMATLLASELIEVVFPENRLRFQIDDEFVKEIQRLLDEKSVKGLVAVVGPAPSYDRAKELISILKEKKLFASFIGVSGESVALQVEDVIKFAGDRDSFFVHLSDEIFGLVQFIGLLVRLAFLESNINPGEARELLSFIKRNYFAFQIVLGEITPPKAAYIAGAISFGVQTVGQVYIPQLLPIHSLP